MQSDRILVVTATYNEIGNIKLLLENIWRVEPNADILVIDDNSPDATGEYLKGHALINSKLYVIQRTHKLGLGTAHLIGFIYAINNHYDYLITMDADLSHDPVSIPILLNSLKTSDFVVGSRYMKGGYCDYIGYRKYLSYLANISARICLGIKLTEFTTSYRGFRVKKLAELDLASFNNKGYSFFMESIFIISKANLLLSEVPISFKDRYSGSSKIPPFEIFNGFKKLIVLTFRRFFIFNKQTNKALINDQCVNCRTSFLITCSDRTLIKSVKTQYYSSYECIRMEHNHIPKIVTCLFCGLSQVSLSN